MMKNKQNRKELANYGLHSKSFLRSNNNQNKFRYKVMKSKYKNRVHNCLDFYVTLT